MEVTRQQLGSGRNAEFRARQLRARDMLRGELEGPELEEHVEQSVLTTTLEKAGRVADFLELGELMCVDALHRRESCGGHFRAESQTEDGEALRHDDEFAYVAAWEFTPPDGADGETGFGAGMGAPVLHKEDLTYEFIELKQRSYK